MPVRAPRRRRPFRDGGDRNAALGDDVAEEADAGAAELALRGLSVQLVVPQRLEHIRHVHQPEMRLALTCQRIRVMMSSPQQCTCTNRPSMGTPEPGGQTAGRARTVESNRDIANVRSESESPPGRGPSLTTDLNDAGPTRAPGRKGSLFTDSRLS